MANVLERVLRFGEGRLLRRLERYAHAINQLEDNPDVWVGILCANTEGQDKPVFCAGADLKAINSGGAGSLATRRGGFAGFVPVLDREDNRRACAGVDRRGVERLGLIGIGEP